MEKSFGTTSTNSNLKKTYENLEKLIENERIISEAIDELEINKKLKLEKKNIEKVIFENEDDENNFNENENDSEDEFNFEKEKFENPKNVVAIKYKKKRNK
jgi:hypothetical protein